MAETESMSQHDDTRPRERQLKKAEANSALRAWLDSARGAQYAALESSLIGAALRSVIGYRLLQIGRWGLDESLYANSPMLQHWIVALDGESDVHLHCDGRALPIANRSIDAVLLPHSLERVTSPHRLLREVDRVLCPHGHVILSGFNPWGLWAAGQRLPWNKARYPRASRFYTLNRVRDWLELLDFELVEVRRFSLRFPRSQEGSEGDALRRLLGPLSQSYQIVARKRIIPLTPIRPRWPRVSVVTPAVLPEARAQRVRWPTR